MTRLLRRPGAILRLEGTIVLIVTLPAFAQVGVPLWWAPIVILLPDILFPKKVTETRIGNFIYNALHTYPLPSLFMFVTVVTDARFEHSMTAFAILWFSHIGFDRMIGRGKKYDGAFIDEQLARAKELQGQMTELHHSPGPNKWGED